MPSWSRVVPGPVPRSGRTGGSARTTDRPRRATAASGTAGEIRATSTITSYYSDERLKQNIQVIPNALDKVMTLRGVTYEPNSIAESFGYKKD